MEPKSTFIHPIKTYKEFWPFYLHEHSHPTTQKLHCIGFFFGVTVTAVLLFLHQGWVSLIGLGGYGFAWFSHFFIEKNRPASFKYPFWSFISEVRLSFIVLFNVFKNR